MGKIGELLSDEESVRQLSELAQMFMSDDREGDSPEDSNTAGGTEDKGSAPDLSSLMKLTGLTGAFSKPDKKSELLLALKPHLREEKQKKVDKAIKLLKLIAIWNMAKESGLLNDIL